MASVIQANGSLASSIIEIGSSILDAVIQKIARIYLFFAAGWIIHQTQTYQDRNLSYWDWKNNLNVKNQVIQQIYQAALLANSYIVVEDVEEKIEKDITANTLQLVDAVIDGRDYQVGYLLSHGANPDVQNEMGMTPLAMNCYQSYFNERVGKIFKALLDAKADVDLQDQNGMTPLMHLVESSQRYVSNGLLIAHPSQVRDMTPYTGKIMGLLVNSRPASTIIRRASDGKNAYEISLNGHPDITAILNAYPK